MKIEEMSEGRRKRSERRRRKGGEREWKALPLPPSLAIASSIIPAFAADVAGRDAIERERASEGACPANGYDRGRRPQLEQNQVSETAKDEHEIGRATRVPKTYPSPL